MRTRSAGPRSPTRPVGSRSRGRRPVCPRSPSRLCAFDSRPAAGARTRTAYTGGPQASSSSTEAGRRPAHRRPIRLPRCARSPERRDRPPTPPWRGSRSGPADPAPGRLVAEERLRPRQRPTHEPPPALAVAHRTGRHVPDLARHGPPLPGGTSPWNRRAEAAAGADRLLSALDPYQRRAAVCFEDRAMVTAGAGSGKTRTMVARAGYAARRPAMGAAVEQPASGAS